MDLTGNPYNNTYDPNKKYNMVLAYPGRAPQSRETIEIQSLFLDLIKRLGDVLMKDGSIVSGCQITIDVAKTKATISSGQIYVQGIVHPVDEQTVNITGTGIETIGVKIVEEIVTAEKDNSLYDPAQSYSNYGQAGADRLKQTLKFFKNDPQAYAVYTLQDSTVVENTQPPTVDVLTDVLARRTYDESENYKVRGLKVTVEPFDSESVQVQVSAGKCYVMGYEISKPAPTVVKLPMSKTFKEVQDEPKLYDKDTSTYLLSTAYVRAVTEVVGQSLVSEYVTRGGILGGLDILPNQPVFDIVAVNQGGDWNDTTQTFTGGKTFRKGTDYQLLDNGVDWSIAPSSSDQPTLGSSYKVVYKYNRHFTQYKDFDLYLNPTNGRHYLRFLTDGVKPIHNTTFNVSYTWYLARKDLLYLDKSGIVSYLSGQPDRYGLEKAPETTNYNLALAYLTLPPNSSQVQVVELENTRITMKGIQDIIKRVNTLEYNIAVSDLDNQAESTESATNLSGIITDGFYSFAKADTTHPDYNATMNLFSKEITIPAESVLKQLTLNTALSNVVQKDLYFLAPYTEKVIASQSFASGTMNINPYKVFNTESSISLDPAVDNWIDESTISLPVTISSSDQVTIPAKFVDDWWTSDVQRLLVNTDVNSTTYTGDPTRIFEQASTFMRQIDITITGGKFSPGSDVKCKFDSKEVPLTPATGYEAGAKAGTVKVNADGTVKATFSIPANTTTGTKTVAIYNDSNYAERPFTSSGFTKIFVQSQTTVVNTVQTFQDIYGARNKILQDAINEALSKANSNTERIGSLEDRTSQLEARVAEVETSLSQMVGLAYEIQRETNETRKQALQAQYDSQKALAASSAATAAANEAVRKAELALLASQAAEQQSSLALAVARNADANAQQALNKANEVQAQVGQLQNVQNQLLAKTQQLESTINSSVGNAQTLTAEINALKGQMQTITTSIKVTQNVVHDLAAKSGYDASFLNAGSVNRIDPLAQSFAFTNAVQISSIEVAFYSKGTLPINCQIRELSAGGMPTTKVAGEKLLNASDIILSTDGSKMTKITFNSPVFIEADKDYCFVLITEDTEYQVFTGKLGEKDLASGAVIGKQPYEIGVLFSSSNNISWNVHNDTDLKFNINAVNVVSDATMVFDAIPSTSVSEIVLAVEQLVPENTSIAWEYGVNSSSTWSPLPTFEKTAVYEVANTVKLKCTLKVDPGSSISPTILKSSAAAYAMSRQSRGDYLTKNVVVTIPYGGVKQVVDMSLPTGTSYELQYSIDDGRTWTVNPMTSTQQVDSKFTRFTHESSVVLPPISMTNTRLTPSNSGGTLPNGNYYYVVTAVNSEGETTGVQVNTTITGGNNSGKVTIDLTDIIPEGAVGINIYRGTAPGTASLKYTLSTLPTAPIVDTGSDDQAAATTPPTTNTAAHKPTKFRGRIVLTTTNILNTPKAKRFINIMRV
jgi:hypothetical protein